MARARAALAQILGWGGGGDTGSGAKALARATVREAAAHLERALVALAHLPTNPARIEMGVDIRLDLRNCLYLVGERSRTLDHLRAA